MPVAHLRMIPYTCGGDMNCDGAINGADIQGFLLALLNPAANATAYPDCNPARADMNGDAVMDDADTALFLSAMLGPND